MKFPTSWKNERCSNPTSLSSVQGGNNPRYVWWRPGRSETHSSRPWNWVIGRRLAWEYELTTLKCHNVALNKWWAWDGSLQIWFLLQQNQRWSCPPWLLTYPRSLVSWRNPRQTNTQNHQQCLVTRLHLLHLQGQPTGRAVGEDETFKWQMSLWSTKLGKTCWPGFSGVEKPPS